MDEARLIAEIKQGNEAAFRQLVEQYEAMVYNTLLGIVQQPEDAEDLAQETFLQAYKSIGSFKGESKISTWLYRIAVTKALEQLRSRKRKKRFGFISSLWSSSEKAEPVAAEGFEHPGVRLENKEKAKMLFRAAKELPENQRVAFMLNKAEGLSYREVSEIMQTSVAAVESLLHRAKQSLQKTLEGYYRE